MKCIVKKIVLLFLISCQYVKSQDYDNLMNILFKGAFQKRENYRDCSDYSPSYDCNCPYPCQGYGNDCNDFYGDPNVEIVYVAPGQYSNIYDFISKKFTTAQTIVSGEETEVMTTPRSAMYTKNEEITTTTPETTKTSPITEATVVNVENKDPFPIEDVAIEVEETEGKETTVRHGDENKYVPISNNEISSNSTIEKNAKVDKKTNESEEYGSNDEYDEKDSEEDRNSVKKSEKVLENSPDIPEDDDSSKPKNVNSWLSF